MRLPVLGPDAPPVWARLATPHAGTDHGFVFRPEVADEVVVGFTNCDPRCPIVLGGVFSSANPPPEPVAEATEENLEKGIVTRSGTRIVISDADDPSITIETPSGSKLRLDDDQEVLEIVDSHGNTMVMSSDGIALTSAADVVIEASGDVRITGASIDMS